jgi:hypothetical protein
MTQIRPICAIVPRKNSIPAADHIGGVWSAFWCGECRDRPIDALIG